MRYKVLNWFNGKVAFTADIDDSGGQPEHRGAAIVWSRDNNESCAGCDISGAVVSDEDFSGKSFKGSDVSASVFTRCDFSNAKFELSNMKNVVFQDCDLSGTKLTKCELQHAKFLDCKFKDTDFTGSHIQAAEFDGSHLKEARLFLVHGVNDHIKCMQIEGYSIIWTADHMYIGCNYAPIGDVFAMGPEYGTHYGGDKGLEFWTRSKDMVVKIAQDRPATPVPGGRSKAPKRRI